MERSSTTISNSGARTVAAISGAIERGVSVSIATGRMATSALRFARELGLRDPIVAYQGALIRAIPEPGDEHLGRLLFHRPLAAAATREVIDWTRSIGLDPHVNHLERFVIRADDPRAEDYSSFLGGRAVVVDDLRRLGAAPVSKVIAVSRGRSTTRCSRSPARGSRAGPPSRSAIRASSSSCARASRRVPPSVARASRRCAAGQRSGDRRPVQ